MIVNHVMRIGFLDLGVFRPVLMQNPHAFCVREKNQTSSIVAIDRGYTVELTGDFGVLGVGKIEDTDGLRRCRLGPSGAGDQGCRA